ncbi:haloacid dehalogenase-like hydrolase family protein [Mycobacterium ulcerans str. Harvey]|uniref:Haloacid dehalogenase-like hydrolase family protein n=1 Tax=Mycobacterium ulcerans str. Harvey TaxID=1299332 RepID=A0ABP3A2A6_MYCUL|nr:haloacid dehalogenase-like hydrolase family protein [Mycobacterium ulcerans str. Harvey]
MPAPARSTGHPDGNDGRLRTRGAVGDFHQGLSGAGNHSRYRRRGIRQDGHADGGEADRQHGDHHGGRVREEVLALASAVEAASEHAVATAIVAASPHPAPVTDFVAVAGCGVSRIVDGHRIEVGKPSWITRNTAADEVLDTARAQGESRGETIVFVSVDGEVCAAVTISDTVKDSAADAIAALRSRACEPSCSPATIRPWPIRWPPSWASIPPSPMYFRTAKST